LKDPLRPGVIDSIKYARDEAKLNVRLISGDHVENAKAVAIKSGILRDKEQLENSVMEGP
jgi:magnesium-transporting ATPase (P-type)